MLALTAGCDPSPTRAVATRRHGDDGKYVVSCLEDLPQQTEVWRAEWNVLGTVLATSGDDGCVRLWRSNFRGKWACVSEVVGDTSGDDSRR